MYIAFAGQEARAAQTVTVVPGVHADFDARGKLIGIEVLDASEVVGQQVEVPLPIRQPAAR